VRVFRLLRIFKSIDLIVSPIDDAVENQVFQLISTLLALVVVCTGFVHYIGQMEHDEWSAGESGIYFHDALYFTIVTFSTVGYGDISPTSPAGRAIITFLILTFIYMIPAQMNKLGQLLDMRSKYGGSYSPKGQDFIVLACERGCSKAVSNFLKEFFHPNHGLIPIKVLVMVPDEPSLTWKNIILNYSSSDNLTYLKGNMLIPRDLERAKLDEALACIIISNMVDDDQSSSSDGGPSSSSSSSSNGGCDTIAKDNNTLLKTLSLKSFFPHLPTYVQIIEPESYPQFRELNVRQNQIVCVKQLKLQLLSQAALWKGFAPLITNLITSISISSHQTTQSWMKDYVHGMDQETYVLSIGPVFEAFTFAEVTRRLYFNYSILMFGIISKKMGVMLNPGVHYKIQHTDQAYVIATDPQDCLQVVEELEMPQMEIGRRKTSLGIPSQRGGSLSFLTDRGVLNLGLQNRKSSRHTNDGQEEEDSITTKDKRNKKSSSITPFQDDSSKNEKTEENRRKLDPKDLKTLIKSKLTFLIGETVEPSQNEASHDQSNELKMGKNLLEIVELHEYKPYDDELKNHIIIVCDGLDDLHCIVRGIRSSFLYSKPIIILCPLHPFFRQSDEESWRELEVHPFVYLIQGSPTSEYDLSRCRVQFAFSIVVSTSQPLQNEESMSVDARTISSLMAIVATMNPQCSLISEINSEELIPLVGNIHTLHSKSSSPSSSFNNNNNSSFHDHIKNINIVNKVRSFHPYSNKSEDDKKKKTANEKDDTNGSDSSSSSSEDDDMVDIFNIHSPSDKTTPPNLELSYARGDVILTNFTDVLLSQAYYDPTILPLVQSLIGATHGSLNPSSSSSMDDISSSDSDSDSEEEEKNWADYFENDEYEEAEKRWKKQRRRENKMVASEAMLYQSKLVQISIPIQFLERIENGEYERNFGCLYSFLLKEYDALCFAIYHYISSPPPSSSSSSSNSKDHFSVQSQSMTVDNQRAFVHTAPLPSTPLSISDLIFVFLKEDWPTYEKLRKDGVRIMGHPNFLEDDMSSFKTDQQEKEEEEKEEKNKKRGVGNRRRSVDERLIKRTMSKQASAKKHKLIKSKSNFSVKQQQEEDEKVVMDKRLEGLEEQIKQLTQLIQDKI